MAKDLASKVEGTVVLDRTSNEAKYLSTVNAYASPSYNCTSCNDEGCNTCVGGGGGPGPE